METLQQNIKKIGVKEIARRSGISASNISRISSGQVNPSLEVAEKISEAIGMRMDLVEDNVAVSSVLQAPRLAYVLRTLRRLRPTLANLGVKHVIVFGSVARSEDTKHSDIDLYVDWGPKRPKTTNLLDADGEILEALPGIKVDIVSNLSTPKGQRLKLQIDKDGQRAF